MMFVEIFKKCILYNKIDLAVDELTKFSEMFMKEGCLKDEEFMRSRYRSSIFELFERIDSSIETNVEKELEYEQNKAIMNDLIRDYISFLTEGQTHVPFSHSMNIWMSKRPPELVDTILSSNGTVYFQDSEVGVKTKQIDLDYETKVRLCEDLLLYGEYVQNGPLIDLCRLLDPQNLCSKAYINQHKYKR
jgi:hypothetical protein